MEHEESEHSKMKETLPTLGFDLLTIRSLVKCVIYFATDQFESRQLKVNDIHLKKKKGRDLTQSYEKSPYTHKKIQKATWQHKNTNKNFDYTTIADRLSSNNIHPNGVVRTVYERSTDPLTTTAV